MLRSQQIAVTTVGADGSAVGNNVGTIPIHGEIKALRVDWHASAPATSDIDITLEADASHPQTVLYDKDDAKDDLWVYPHVQATSTAGAGITGVYVPIVGSGYPKVAVAQCNALAPAVTVTVYWEE